MDPNLAWSSVRPGGGNPGRSDCLAQALAYLAAIFGGVALLLASAGICGALAYEVHRRAPEFTVRLALGTTRVQVMGLVWANWDAGWRLAS